MVFRTFFVQFGTYFVHSEYSLKNCKWINIYIIIISTEFGGHEHHQLPKLTRSPSGIDVKDTRERVRQALI